MHFELGHHVYDPTDKSQPDVASTGRPSPVPPVRASSMSRRRSASNPALSMDRYASHFPSGEYRGVLSAPAFVMMGRSFPPLPTTKRSTFVLSATEVSPCIATTVSRPSGDTATSPSPPVAIVGAS